MSKGIQSHSGSLSKLVMGKKYNRRDFFTLAASTVAGVGAVCAAVPLVHSLNPSREVLADAVTEIGVSDMSPGDTKTVKWQGKPVFIRRVLMQDIDNEGGFNYNSLRDPQSYVERVSKQRGDFVIATGLCTHLGCVPVGNSGDYGGWFCPCHGSHYDKFGRVRAGPAPRNLDIPPYFFKTHDTVVIGAYGDEKV